MGSYPQSGQPQAVYAGQSGHQYVGPAGQAPPASVPGFQPQVKVKAVGYGKWWKGEGDELRGEGAVYAGQNGS